jgi:hypothetical protein
LSRFRNILSQKRTLESVLIDICARSSMDRIKDSGSFDWGSTPHGRT